jgi:hypothetical protein
MDRFVFFDAGVSEFKHFAARGLVLATFPLLPLATIVGEPPLQLASVFDDFNHVIGTPNLRRIPIMPAHFDNRIG